MTGKTFISYRREDSRFATKLIYSHLSRLFGRDRLFMDVQTMAPGDDFPQKIKQNLVETKVMLVVIGPDWADIKNEEGGHRLFDKKDPVRIEIAQALTSVEKVIPVLVDGATMPRADQLPNELQDLLPLHAISLRKDEFETDLRGLDELLFPHMGRALRRGAGLAFAVAVAAALIGVGVWQALPLLRTTAQPGDAEAVASKSAAKGPETGTTLSESERLLQERLDQALADLDEAEARAKAAEDRAKFERDRADRAEEAERRTKRSADEADRRADDAERRAEEAERERDQALRDLETATTRPSVAPSPSGDGFTYRAYISRDDLFSSRGTQLKSAAEIIQQDRANVHRFGKADASDQFDSYFTTGARREALGRALAGRIPSSLARAIKAGGVLVEVRVRLSGNSIASVEVQRAR